MRIAARTAPKAAGQDFVEIKLLENEELDDLADEMRRYGEESGKKDFDRDGECVRESEAVFLASLEEPQAVGLDCGACGNSKCSDLRKEEGPEFKGPNCAWRLLDLGIALGSAVKTASMLNVDNRVMYRVGVVAREMDLIEGDIVVGVPLSVKGKNIYFDR
ncbi:hypothetical protein C9439_04470 [archaeon SCG-AAA382B04]|nr:hypothetical protein C9439_04470 [archaeon SCG-AAA382B04]